MFRFQVLLTVWIRFASTKASKEGWIEGNHKHFNEKEGKVGS